MNPDDYNSFIGVYVKLFWVPHPWYIPCDGRAIDMTKYAELYKAIGIWASKT